MPSTNRALATGVQTRTQATTRPATSARTAPDGRAATGRCARRLRCRSRARGESMRQLTTLDAQFLAVESARTYGHVGSLAVYDPSTAPGGTFEIADVCRLVGERIHLLPPLHWRLARVPFGVDLPYWTEDPDFDLDFHIRESAIPPPGDDRRLAETVARIFARPLDRSRPLWEIYLIHGLPDGDVALLTKIHHAVVDGVSGNEILTVLLDQSPEGRELPQPDPAPRARRMPGDLELLGRGVLGLPRQPLRALRAIPTTLPNVTELPGVAALPGGPTVSRAVGRLRGALGRQDPAILEATTARPPRTPFNGPISAHRGFAFGQLSLDAVKSLKGALGLTVNDVVVALCAGAVRQWLLARDALPDAPLVAMVRMSVRTEEQQGTFGNPRLDDDRADPDRRARRGRAPPAHARVAAQREGAPQGPAGRPAHRRDRVHPAGRRGARGAHDDADPRPYAPAGEPRDLERARPADPALSRRRAAAGDLSRVGGRRRRRAEHHRHELPRPPGLRHRRRREQVDDVWSMLDGLRAELAAFQAAAGMTPAPDAGPKPRGRARAAT